MIRNPAQHIFYLELAISQEDTRFHLHRKHAALSFAGSHARNVRNQGKTRSATLSRCVFFFCWFREKRELHALRSIIMLGCRLVHGPLQECPPPREKRRGKVRETLHGKLTHRETGQSIARKLKEVNEQRGSKETTKFHILQFMKSLRGGPFFAFSLPGGRRALLLPRHLRHCPQSKSAALPKPRVKQSQAFQDGIIS